VERADFERHLAECESCTQEVRELRDTAALLALAAAEPPPPALKQRVFTEIQTVRQLPPDTNVVPLRRRSVVQRLTTVAAAVFFVAAAGLGVVVVQQNSRLDESNAQLAQMREILSAPDAELLTLEDTPAGDGAGTMKVAVSRKQDRMLFVSGDLVSPDEGKTYQLWAVADDIPRSLGTFEPTDGEVAKGLSGLGDADSVAISVEPDSGSAKPTTVVMQGDLPAL
jgi:hypothetical protein